MREEKILPGALWVSHFPQVSHLGKQGWAPHSTPGGSSELKDLTRKAVTVIVSYSLRTSKEQPSVDGIHPFVQVGADPMVKHTETLFPGFVLGLPCVLESLQLLRAVWNRKSIVY